MPLFQRRLPLKRLEATVPLFLHWIFSFQNILVIQRLYAQKLASGEDPIEAFVSSAEAAVAGAESTKNMQAQVINYLKCMNAAPTFDI